MVRETQTNRERWTNQNSINLTSSESEICKVPFFLFSVMNSENMRKRIKYFPSWISPPESQTTETFTFLPFLSTFHEISKEFCHITYFQHNWKRVTCFSIRKLFFNKQISFNSVALGPIHMSYAAYQTKIPHGHGDQMPSFKKSKFYF